MPLDDFDLSPDLLAPPLDIGAGTPPFVSPGQGGGFNAKEFAPLLALLPMAAKGGPGAVGALMRGLQRARAMRQQQGRMEAQDARMASQQTSMDQYRQAQMQQAQVQQQAQAKNAELQRRQQFMGQFNTALGGVDDPEAVKALIDFYGGQAQDFGVDRPALEQFAMQTATPDRLTARKVSKRWEKMGVEARELAQTTKASLQIDGQTIPYQTWAPLVGGMVDPTTGAYPQAPPKPVLDRPEARSLDVQAADALAKGDTETYQRLLKVKREMGQADDRPVQGPDPVLQELRQVRLEQAKGSESRLPEPIRRRAEQLSDQYKNEAIVKRTNTMAEAYSFVQQLPNDNRNPAFDQALIYAFAKAQDPESVVREGEYATVQKYAQSWLDNLKFNALRVVNNQEFLTPQARAQMKEAIRLRYSTSRSMYDNVRKQYAEQIKRVTGQDVGNEYLVDYASGFPVMEGQPAPTAPAGGKQRVGRFEISVAP